MTPEQPPPTWDDIDRLAAENNLLRNWATMLSSNRCDCDQIGNGIRSVCLPCMWRHRKDN